MALQKVNALYPDILRRTAVHQTNTALPWLGPAFTNYSVNSVGTVNRYTQRHGVRLKAFEVHNRSGSNIHCGVGFRWANHTWMGGRYDGTTFTDITSTLQGTGTTTIQVTGADQTGLVILSEQPFSWMSTEVTTAETNAGGVTVVDHVLRYSNNAGTDWVTFDANSAFVDNWTTTNAVWAAEVKNFVWAPPVDWGKSVSLTGLPNGYYALHLQSAQREASDVAAIVTGFEIGSMWTIDTLTDNGIWEQEKANYDDPFGEALVGFFATANAGNRIIATIETR